MMRGRTYALIVSLTIATPALADYTAPGTVPISITRISDGSSVNPNSLSLSASGLSAIGVTQMRANYPSLTGAGQTVVVIDTGIDYTHPALASNYLTGFDFTTGLADPMDNYAGAGGHGTHVAGIIASTNATYQGVAPGAKIIALKVADSNTGMISDANVVAALNWVAAHKVQYNITTVNVSLGDSIETTWSNILPNDPYDTALHNLKNQGVFVAVASGNDAFLHGQAMPAASRYAVSVGATWVNNDYAQYILGYSDQSILDPYPQPDINGVLQPARDVDYGPRQDNIAFFSNRYKTASDGSTNLMAPGAFITSTVPLSFDTDGILDGFQNNAGTSMAAPHVAGAAMLIRQALEESGKLDPDPTKQVDQILTILKSTSTDLWDFHWIFGGDNASAMYIPNTSSNLYIGRGTLEHFDLINVNAAINSIVPEPASLGLLALAAPALLLRRTRRAK
jgi:subtilisin family serine protease